MPEAPELEVIREFLASRVAGLALTSASEHSPLVMRNLIDAPFGQDAPGRSIDAARRRGKTLLIDLSGDRLVLIVPMLAGGVRYCPARERIRASTCVTFTLSNGFELRYFEKRMGVVYYLRSDQKGDVPRLNDLGPDVLDSPLPLDAFRERLKPFRGEIKGVLTRGRAVYGIGNAYADEILFAAGNLPVQEADTPLSGRDQPPA